jgi:hypothetical protein
MNSPAMSQSRWSQAANQCTVADMPAHPNWLQGPRRRPTRRRASCRRTAWACAAGGTRRRCAASGTLGTRATALRMTRPRCLRGTRYGTLVTFSNQASLLGPACNETTRQRPDKVPHLCFLGSCDPSLSSEGVISLQLYIVFVVADGGTDLERFELRTLAEAKSILLQVLCGRTQCICSECKSRVC